jgi:hypothetical protein
MVQVTGQVVEGEPSTGIAQSLMGNAWWVANTSLVLPAVIFLAAAYLLFNSANSERARVNETILKQLSEHAEQRQKAFDRYDALLKSVEDNLTAQSRHFRDLYQLEAEMMKARLEQVKNQPSGAGQAR